MLVKLILSFLTLYEPSRWVESLKWLIFLLSFLDARNSLTITRYCLQSWFYVLRSVVIFDFIPWLWDSNCYYIVVFTCSTAYLCIHRPILLKSVYWKPTLSTSAVLITNSDTCACARFLLWIPWIISIDDKMATPLISSLTIWYHLVHLFNGLLDLRFYRLFPLPDYLPTSRTL